jgi:D-beta-D-heptose 7-phosphate kinase/D-beta-D-heptose 1-phosphate adenosyltransferase
MNKGNLQKILSGIGGRRVLVVGDVMLDEFIWGEVRRISPEAPVPVVAVRRRTYAPGGAANSAANVMSLGGVALLAGVAGNDHHGVQLREALAQAAINTDGLLAEDGRITTTKTRIIAQSQQVVRMDYEEPGPLSAVVEDRLLQWVEDQLPCVDACILSDYAKGVVSPRLAQGLIRMARTMSRPVIVDPKGTNYAKYVGATVVKPNIHEAAQCAKREIHDAASLLEAGRTLAEMLEGSAVLLTQGAQGMTLFESGSPPAHLPSVARNVFDVTGAGDTVASVLALALATGAGLVPAAQLANRAAGIVVGKTGTATTTLDELRKEMLRSRRVGRRSPPPSSTAREAVHS